MTTWRPIFEYKDNPVTANAYASAHAYGGAQQQQQPTAIQQWLQGYMNNGGGGGPGYSDTSSVPMNPLSSYPESQPADEQYMIPTNPPDGGQGLTVPGHGGNTNGPGVQNYGQAPPLPPGGASRSTIPSFNDPRWQTGDPNGPDYMRNPMVQYPQEYADPGTGVTGMDYGDRGGPFVPYWEAGGYPIEESFPLSGWGEY